MEALKRSFEHVWLLLKDPEARQTLLFLTLWMLIPLLGSCIVLGWGRAYARRRMARVPGLPDASWQAAWDEHLAQGTPACLAILAVVYVVWVVFILVALASPFVAFVVSLGIMFVRGALPVNDVVGSVFMIVMAFLAMLVGGMLALGGCAWLAVAVQALLLRCEVMDSKFRALSPLGILKTTLNMVGPSFWFYVVMALSCFVLIVTCPLMPFGVALLYVCQCEMRLWGYAKALDKGMKPFDFNPTEAELERWGVEA